MMLPYADVDLDDTPIVVLGCRGRHFFTVETLDGIIGMKDVYDIDLTTGNYIALKENEQLALRVPQCPTCREPVRQYATQRYNRVVNRAVIDEVSKRFIVSGQQKLQELLSKLRSVEQSLESTRSKLLPGMDISSRYVKASGLEKEARSFLRGVKDSNKPSRKLHEACVHAASKQTELIDSMAQLNFTSTGSSKTQDNDRRIILGGRLFHLKVRQLVLYDNFELLRVSKSRISVTDFSFQGGSPADRSGSFLQDCLELIKACKSANSTKLAVEATLYYAHITQLVGSSGAVKEAARPQVAQHRESAKVLLKEAEKLCEGALQGHDQLRKGIEKLLHLLDRDFYTEVTKEEVEAIKQAMVSGQGGIASHSGHWYNCANGHPVGLFR